MKAKRKKSSPSPNYFLPLKFLNGQFSYRWDRKKALRIWLMINVNVKTTLQLFLVCSRNEAKSSNRHYQHISYFFIAILLKACALSTIPSHLSPFPYLSHPVLPPFSHSLLHPSLNLQIGEIFLIVSWFGIFCLFTWEANSSILKYGF